MAQINLNAPQSFNTAVLIADVFSQTGGSNDSLAELTKVGGPFGQTVSAALEIQSVLGGVLFPRMTTAQMNALTPVNGMLIYNTTAGAFYGYAAGMWGTVGGGGAVSITSTNGNIVVAPSPLTGTGTLTLASTLTGISSVGSATSLSLATNAGTNAITIDTAQNSAFFGYIRINNNAGLILDNVGNTQATTIIAGAIASNFTITLPAAQPTISNNQALTATTAGVTQWTTVAVQGGNTLASNLTLGTNDANSVILRTNGTTALTVNSSQNATFAGTLTANGASITSGVASTTTGSLIVASAGGGTLTQTVPGAGVTTYSITWPSAAPAGNGYILSSTTGGVLSWISNAETSGTANTLAYFNSGGVLASNTNVTVHSGGDITTTSTLQAGNLTLNTNNINASGSLFLATNGSTTALQLDASQNATFFSTVRINSNAGLILDNAGNTQATTITAGAIASNFTIALPATQPTISNNQALTATTSSVCQWTTVAVNGGNTLGAALTLGTTDANALVMKTGGTIALTIDTSQNANFNGNVRINSNQGLILDNAGNTQATTLVAGAIASNFTITLPATLPTINNNQALTATTAGVSQFTTVAVNGGNTLGAALTLGTTDANSLIMQTNGSTALTLDTSQNSTFNGNISLINSNGITLGSNATGGSSFGPQIKLEANSGRVLTIDMNNSISNGVNIATTGNAQITLSPANTLNFNPGTLVGFQTNARFQSSQNTWLFWQNTGAWVNPALSTAGSVIQVPSITYQDNSTAASGTNAGPACVWSFNTPTLSATHTSVTTTIAATVYVGGSPVAGTNQTITNAYSLYVNSGTSLFGGVVDFSGGTSATATTGAGTLPAQPVGFINILIAGTAYRVPYYAV